jgi:sec-independent protein translocase protein TatC
MTSSQDIDTTTPPSIDLEVQGDSKPEIDPIDPLDDLPGEVEMSIFDHLEELRQRIFYSLIAVAVGVIGCF